MAMPDKNKTIIAKISIYKSTLASNYRSTNLLGKTIIWMTAIGFLIGIPIGIASYFQSCVSSRKTDDVLSEIATSTKNTENMLLRFWEEHRHELNQTLSTNHDLLSISPSGQLVPLGKLDPNILKIDWKNVHVSISETRIIIHIPHLTFKAPDGGKLIVHDSAVKLRKEMGSTFKLARSGSKGLFFMLIGKQQDFYIVGVGLIQH